MSRRAGRFPINGRVSSSIKHSNGASPANFGWPGTNDQDLEEPVVRVLRRATSPVRQRSRDDLNADATADFDDEPSSQPLPSSLDHGGDIEDLHIKDDPVVVTYRRRRAQSPSSPIPWQDWNSYTDPDNHRILRDAHRRKSNYAFEAAPPGLHTVNRQHVVRLTTETVTNPAALRRESSDQAAYHSNEFRTVKPFAFIPQGISIHGTGSTKSPNELLSDSESALPDDSAVFDTPDADDSASPSEQTTKIYSSLYTGDGYYDGSHSAELAVIKDPLARTKPIFRWLHVQQSLLQFEQFSLHISHLSGLTDSQRTAISDTLRYVRKHFVRSRQTSQGTLIRYMEPAVYQGEHAPDGNSAMESNDPRTSSTSTASNTASRVVWLSLPYFFLDLYSGQAAGEGHNRSFPPLTLLQVQYSGNSRDRDMTQAICRLGLVPRGWCYHIGQLWAMVVDDAILITCGTMTEAALRGRSIKLNSGLIQQRSLDEKATVAPPNNNAPAPVMAKIYVQYGSSFMWALPVQECQTWFSFIRHFREFWPLSIIFKYRSAAIKPYQWPKVLRIASKPKTVMTLTLETAQPPRPFIGGILPNPLSSATTASQDPSITVQLSPPVRLRNAKDSDEQREPFHVFTWMSKCKAFESSTDPLLARIMDQEDEFLREGSGSHDGHAYRHARTDSRENVYEYLRRNENLRGETPEYVVKVNLFNSADLVFQFFLPLGAALPTCSQFWGSIMTLAQGQESPGSVKFSDRNAADDNVELAATRLESLAGSFQVFRWMMSYASDLDRAEIAMPGLLTRAWLHVIMGLVHATHGGPSVPADDFWLQHLDMAYQYMLEGMRIMVDSLTREPLVRYAAVRPMEVLGMMSLELVEDVAGAYTNVTDTYETYLRALESDIAARPSPSNQYRINNVKGEINIVRQIRMSQLGILKCLRAMYKGTKTPEMPMQRANGPVGRFLSMPQPVQPSINEDRMEQFDALPPAPLETFSRISSTTPGGLKMLIFSDVCRILEDKIKDFEEFEGQTRMLEESNTVQYDVARDRQERATYAFTLVTIIFLPLSAVASIFGINTTDIRDMNQGQWLYWTIAVPVTVLVIVVGLWWMGELWTLLGWCLRRLGVSYMGRTGRSLLSRDSGRVSNELWSDGTEADETGETDDDGPRIRPVKRSMWDMSGYVSKFTPHRRDKWRKGSKGRDNNNNNNNNNSNNRVNNNVDYSDDNGNDGRSQATDEKIRREVAKALEMERRRQERINGGRSSVSYMERDMDSRDSSGNQRASADRTRGKTPERDEGKEPTGTESSTLRPSTQTHIVVSPLSSDGNNTEPKTNK